jgi:hypothetical protein
VKQTHKIFQFADTNNIFFRTFPELSGGSSLVTLDIVGNHIKQIIIKKWKYYFSRVQDNIFEISSPILTPIKILKKSGHLQKFIDQNNNLFYTSHDLTLRPETCQAIFSNFTKYKHKIKGQVFGISQIGTSFRDQKTSEVSLIRLKEFQQLELEIFSYKVLENYSKYYIKTLIKGNKFQDYILLDDLGLKYIPRLISLVLSLGFNIKNIYLENLKSENLPHYSIKTIDLYAKIQNQYIELASINYRKDLLDSSNVYIFEISLGLHRLIWGITQISYIKNKTRLELPELFCKTCIVYDILPETIKNPDYIYIKYNTSYKSSIESLKPLKHITNIILLNNGRISKLEYNFKINFLELNSNQGLNLLSKI